MTDIWTIKEDIMSTYRIDQANMPALVEALRPAMVEDSAFMSECGRSMQVFADHVLIHLGTPADARLHKAAVELGTLLR